MKIPSRGSKDAEKVAAHGNRRLDTIQGAITVGGSGPAGHTESLLTLSYKVEARGL